jgi:tRNA pseudouridine13 synthase
VLGAQGELEKAILDGEGVSAKEFLIRSVPELSCEGDLRRSSTNMRAVPKIVSEGSIVVEFTLPKGSYATTALREFMKADPLSY